MEQYFKWDYAGTAFELFGPAHLGALLVLGLTGYWIVRSGERGSDALRTVLRRSLVVVLVTNELAWHVWALVNGHWTPRTMLPLHACSFMVWWTAWAFWFDVKWMRLPIYYMGIAGAMQALITPDAGVYGFPHFLFFETLIAHSILVIAGIWTARVDGFRPTLRNLLGMFAILNLYALVVYFINQAVGSNYLYVNGKPIVPSLIDYMPAWPWYIPLLEFLALLLFLLLWLPYRRSDEVMARSGARSAQVEGPASPLGA